MLNNKNNYRTQNSCKQKASQIIEMKAIIRSQINSVQMLKHFNLIQLENQIFMMKYLLD